MPTCNPKKKEIIKIASSIFITLKPGDAWEYCIVDGKVRVTRDCVSLYFNEEEFLDNFIRKNETRKTVV